MKEMCLVLVEWLLFFCIMKWTDKWLYVAIITVVAICNYVCVQKMNRDQIIGPRWGKKWIVVVSLTAWSARILYYLKSEWHKFQQIK